MSEKIIEAFNLSKDYKGVTALNNFSFSMEKGEVIGLVGKNGAGKTTLLRLLSGLALPSSGSISLFGESDPRKLVAMRKKMTVMVEYPALYMNLTAKDNMMERCIMEGMKRKELGPFIRDQLDFVGLFGAYADPRRVKAYSMGMRQRLSIAMAMVTQPEIMLLDEPTNGLDPDGIRQIRDLLLSLNRDKGVSILVSSHILGELSKVATRYLFIDNGKLLEDITSSDLERKVGRTLTIKTSDNARVLELLKQGKYDARISDEYIIISKVVNAAEILNYLSSNKVDLLYFVENENTLEDYYLSLLGGKKNV